MHNNFCCFLCQRNPYYQKKKCLSDNLIPIYAISSSHLSISSFSFHHSDLTWLPGALPLILPSQVPSSPTCSSPERGGEQDSLYGDGYTKIYNRFTFSHNSAWTGLRVEVNIKYKYTYTYMHIVYPQA